ncbi:MAG: N-acetylmannosamine-6-phosphate 2-epimerase [Eubacteriales bacterium]
MSNQEVLEQVKGGLIVSCQALPEEPLFGADTMGKMAYAAFLGGASGIRANTIVDIHKIKEVVELPIIGIIKRVFEGCNVYITPTMEEVDALVEEGVSIIAIDATKRPRPNGESIDDLFQVIRKKYPNQLFMADCSTYEEGKHAEELGFDLVGTTLSGYTDYTKGQSLPDYTLIEKLSSDLKVPVVAEGGIWSPKELMKALEVGAFTAVVGTAITRPMDITKRYVEAIKR